MFFLNTIRNIANQNKILLFAYHFHKINCTINGHSPQNNENKNLSLKISKISEKMKTLSQAVRPKKKHKIKNAKLLKNPKDLHQSNSIHFCFFS